MVNRTIVLKELEKYAVFTSKAFADVVEKGKLYADLFLHRLRKANMVFAIEKNKYTLHQDALIIASNIVWPSYISCWAVFRYYNLTEQLPWTIDVITTRAKKNRLIEFANAKIVFIRTNPDNLFGFGKFYYKGFEVFMAEKEKAIVDAFVFRKASSEELLEIISNNVHELDSNKIVKYLARMVRKPWNKRVKHFIAEVKKHAE